MSRRNTNIKQDTIASLDYYPSKTSFREGDLAVALPNNKPARLYKKLKGILWWANLTKDGNESVEGNLNVGGSITASGVKFTKSYLSFGYNASISSSNTYELTTVNGVQNGMGYRMMRSGRVTGLSAQMDVSAAFDTGQADFYIYKNGSQSTEFSISAAPASTGDYGDTNIIGNLTFVSGDTLTVKVVLSSMTLGAIDDIAVLIEVEV